MYYQKGDRFEWNKKIVIIQDIAGLYSAGPVVLTLKEEETNKKVSIHYTKEFYPRIIKGEIKPLFSRQPQGYG